VLSALKRSQFSTWPRHLGRAGAVVAGLLLGALFVVGSQLSLVPALQFAVGFGLTGLGLSRRIPLLYVLPAAAGAALAVSLLQS
jgi:hypothetical protein